jgi:LysM repeat protein
MIKLFVLIGFSFFNSPVEKDSLGVETINGKMFVIHKVDEKETLYAISRRYGATVESIRQFNTSVDAGLEVGQILKVPYTPKVTRQGQGLVHTVAAKETLFSISKIYGVSMDELKQWNNLTDNALSIGQELVIKKKNTVNTISVSNQSTHATVAKKGTHVVAEKETMYSITRQYGITVDQLKEWNDLQTNELKIGQILIVAKSEPVAQTKTEPVVTKKEPANSTVNSNTSSTTSTQNTQTVTTPKTEPAKDPVITKAPEPVVKETPVIQEPIRISESVKNSDEIVEGGLAELIEGTEGNRKYLALHRTAPVGTILKVRNEMNNREVFVRVMGKLPDTAFTDKLVIKISKSAYDRLGAIDARFRVEVTYYK